LSAAAGSRLWRRLVRERRIRSATASANNAVATFRERCRQQCSDGNLQKPSPHAIMPDVVSAGAVGLLRQTMLVCRARHNAQLNQAGAYTLLRYRLHRDQARKLHSIRWYCASSERRAVERIHHRPFKLLERKDARTARKFNHPGLRNATATGVIDEVT